MMKGFTDNAIAASMLDTDGKNWTVRKPTLAIHEHDTTDDFMVSASESNGSRIVEIEFNFDTGLALARWILDAVAERQSPEGQAEKERHIRQAEQITARIVAHTTDI